MRRLVAGLVVVFGARFTAPAGAAPPGDRPRLDPAAWGTDHVGQPLPEYMESGECLFCHRTEVGVTWGDNKHNRTIREAEAGGAGAGRADGRSPRPSDAPTRCN